MLEAINELANSLDLFFGESSQLENEDTDLFAVVLWSVAWFCDWTEQAQKSFDVLECNEQGQKIIRDSFAPLQARYHHADRGADRLYPLCSCTPWIVRDGVGSWSAGPLMETAQRVANERWPGRYDRVLSTFWRVGVPQIPGRLRLQMKPLLENQGELVAIARAASKTAPVEPLASHELESCQANSAKVPNSGPDSLICASALASSEAIRSLRRNNHERRSPPELRERGIGDVRVISQSGAESRRRAAEEALNRMGFADNWSYLDAVNGGQVPTESMHRLLSAKLLFGALHSTGAGYVYGQFSVGGVGVALSHIASWLHLVESDDEDFRAIIIFEDDIRCQDNALHYMTGLIDDAGGVDNFDVLRFSWFASSDQAGSSIEAHSRELWRERGVVYGFESMVISKRGAYRMLAEALPMYAPIDALPSYMAGIFPDFVHLIARQPGTKWERLCYQDDGAFPSSIAYSFGLETWAARRTVSSIIETLVHGNSSMKVHGYAETSNHLALTEDGNEDSWMMDACLLTEKGCPGEEKPFRIVVVYPTS